MKRYAFVTLLVMIGAVESVVLAESNSPATGLSSRKASGSVSAMPTALASIVPPLSTLDIVKNAEHVFRQRLLREDIFFTTENLVRVFGLDKNDWAPVAAHKWIFRKDEVQEVINTCPPEPGINIRCPWLVTFQTPKGKRAIEAYWETSMRAKDMWIDIDRWRGGTDYSPGYSNAVQISIRFIGSSSLNFADAREYFLGQGYQVNTSKPVTETKNIQRMLLESNGPDASARSIWLVGVNGILSVVAFTEEYK